MGRIGWPGPLRQQGLVRGRVSTRARNLALTPVRAGQWEISAPGQVGEEVGNVGDPGVDLAARRSRVRNDPDNDQDDYGPGQNLRCQACPLPARLPRPRDHNGLASWNAALTGTSSLAWDHRDSADHHVSLLIAVYESLPASTFAGRIARVRRMRPPIPGPAGQGGDGPDDQGPEHERRRDTEPPGPPVGSGTPVPGHRGSAFLISRITSEDAAPALTRAEPSLQTRRAELDRGGDEGPAGCRPQALSPPSSPMVTWAGQE
jgi:hypothetical protein